MRINRTFNGLNKIGLIFKEKSQPTKNFLYGKLKKINDAEMTNIIGKDILEYRNKIFSKNEFFFDYLKKEIKAKRKMGHITTLIK